MGQNSIGRYGTLANLDLQLAGIKSAGYQAAADAAIQQGEHLQEIGGGGGGGESSGGGGGIDQDNLSSIIGMFSSGG